MGTAAAAAETLPALDEQHVWITPLWRGRPVLPTQPVAWAPVVEIEWPIPRRLRVDMAEIWDEATGCRSFADLRGPRLLLWAGDTLRVRIPLDRL